MSQIVILIVNGRACPHFECDDCHLPIKCDDGVFANVVWERDHREDHPMATRIVCKKCDSKQDGRLQTSWMDLETAWYFLKGNSRFSSARAKRNADLLEGL
jgi:hypothetical protein